MKIKCSKKDLVEAVNIVQKSVAVKSTVPVLEGIYIEAKGNVMIFRGSDADMSSETVFVTDVSEEGKIVVDSRMFGDLIRKLPNTDIIMETQKDMNAVNISAENSALSLLYMNADEFPSFPGIEDAMGIEITEGLFRKMVKRIIFCVSNEDSRPILTGGLFDLEDGVLRMVGLDSFRMAVSTEEFPGFEGTLQRVIPGKTLRDVMSITGDNENPMNISFTDNHVLFTLGNTKIISRLLQGEYFKYRTMIPDYSKLSVKVSRQDLLSSSERASLLATEGTTNLIKFSFTPNEILITSNSKQGKIREEVACESEGEEIEIAFNAKFMVDALKNMEDDTVRMELTSPLTPCIVKPLESDSAQYILLPVRIAKR